MRSFHASCRRKAELVLESTSFSKRSGALAPSHWPSMPPIDRPHQLTFFGLQPVEDREHVACRDAPSYTAPWARRICHGRGGRSARGGNARRKRSPAGPTCAGWCRVNSTASAPVHRAGLELRRAAGIRPEEIIAIQFLRGRGPPAAGLGRYHDDSASTLRRPSL